MKACRFLFLERIIMSVSTTLANKKRRLEKHIRRFPDDLRAAAAAKNFSPSPRKAPLSKKWTKPSKKMAEVAAKLGYVGTSALYEGGLTQSKKYLQKLHQPVHLVYKEKEAA